MAQRWKLIIEYDGTDFCGWQWQENGLSIQECLETAVFKFSGERVAAHVAGRTDSGVHAVGQVAHIDLERVSEAKTIRDAINFHLRPKPIAIVEAIPVEGNFHARLGALKRTYCYKILCNRRAPTMIDANRVWHFSRDLDVASMNKAAKHLIGTHDFSSFRAAECQAKSPIKTLSRLEFIEHTDALGFGKHIEMWAEARSFLHHQIRNFVGTLKLVGEGKWSPDDVKVALEARDRTKAGPMAPSSGLYFVAVDYGDPSIFMKAVDSLI